MVYMKEEDNIIMSRN